MCWSRWLAIGEAWKVKGLAPAKAWAQAGGSTMGPRLSLLAHCEGEPQHHCDPFTPSSLWDKQEGRWILGAQWAGGLGAPVALGTPMAMAEWPPPEWASYHSPNTNNCQDRSISVARLLSLPGLLHSPPSSPLSVSFSSSSFLSMSPSRAVFLCLSGELWGPSLRPDTWAARCRAQSWRP